MDLIMQIRTALGIYGLAMINLCKAEHFHFPFLKYSEDSSLTKKTIQGKMLFYVLEVFPPVCCGLVADFTRHLIGRSQSGLPYLKSLSLEAWRS